MASLREIMAIAPELLELDDFDLKILDEALSDLTDKYREQLANKQEAYNPLQDNALMHLHGLVLRIKRGD